ncbi:MAG: peptidoglycan DL-endopeptidase CwlO [Actinomycetota bacterium]|nr:peptidoglycan DL-endopeptidase CwlO [Actinomycetota bacterium]
MGEHDHNAHPAPTRSKRLILGLAVTLVMGSTTIGLSVAPAGAAPAPVPAPRPDAPPPKPDVRPPATATTLPGPPTDLAAGIEAATKLQLQITANAKRADVLDENYLKAQRSVKVADRKVAEEQAQITATNVRVDELRHQLAGRAAFLYMGSGSNDPIGIDASSVQELGSMAKYGDAAAERDQHLLDDLKRTHDKLDAQRTHLAGELAAARSRQRAARDARREVARMNAAMMKLLDTTQSSVKLLATKMEQDARAAASIAEQDWLQRLAKRQAAARKAGPGAPADAGGLFADLPMPSAGALLAVAYAEKQLGKPYVYAGAGPDVFDCSGLTMMAWLQSGVAMVHGSQAQFDAFPHVPIDQLQPGDLVFFGDSGPTNHHVGIVVAPGIMIDAPHTGAYVELVSYFRPDLVPLGARPSAP